MQEQPKRNEGDAVKEGGTKIQKPKFNTKLAEEKWQIAQDLKYVTGAANRRELQAKLDSVTHLISQSEREDADKMEDEKAANPQARVSNAYKRSLKRDSINYEPSMSFSQDQKSAMDAMLGLFKDQISKLAGGSDKLQAIEVKNDLALKDLIDTFVIKYRYEGGDFVSNILGKKFAEEGVSLKRGYSVSGDGHTALLPRDYDIKGKSDVFLKKFNQVVEDYEVAFGLQNGPLLRTDKNEAAYKLDQEKEAKQKSAADQEAFLVRETKNSIKRFEEDERRLDGEITSFISAMGVIFPKRRNFMNGSSYDLAEKHLEDLRRQLEKVQGLRANEQDNFYSLQNKK